MRVLKLRSNGTLVKRAPKPEQRQGRWQRTPRKENAAIAEKRAIRPENAPRTKETQKEAGAKEDTKEPGTKEDSEENAKESGNLMKMKHHGDFY